MDRTKIQWTDATWNPVTGCTKVSAGCKNCYAEAVAGRWWGERKFTDVQTHADRLDQPLRWRRPRRVFVNSMSDLFHDAVPSDFILRVFLTMAAAPQHTFQVLTKRPLRMRHLLLHWLPSAMQLADTLRLLAPQWPLPNVWLGVSVEDQRAADERIPLLLDTPAALRFLSCEPLLGPVDIREWMWPVHANWPAGYASPEAAIKAGAALRYVRQGMVLAGTPFVRWVIAGGESGPGARPCDVAWIRSIVEQCKAAGVPAFVKQLGAVVGDSACEDSERFVGFGENPIHYLRRRVTLDRKGGDMQEWPEDLRVREFPAVEART